MVAQQLSLFPKDPTTIPPFKTQFLKWIGNKQRIAHTIISHFPWHYDNYIEPFVGSGAVLGTLAPQRAIASDVMKPLIDLWQMLQSQPETVIEWYTTRWKRFQAQPDYAYRSIQASYNAAANAADLLFLSRSCYGGVIRFRKDGYMSTPQGVHTPISPESFRERALTWHQRIQGTTFLHGDFEATMAAAQKDDIVYCDPPYWETQAILYGAQAFSLPRLLKSISECKDRGVHVVLSIDGTKKSGKNPIAIPFPPGLFEHEVYLTLGRSMLRRFQLEGSTLEAEIVTDRLLLTY